MADGTDYPFQTRLVVGIPVADVPALLSADLPPLMVDILATDPDDYRSALGLGPLKTPQDFGAVCNGVTDDSAALSRASAAGALIVHRSGILRVATNTTLTTPLYMEPGAALLMDNAVLAFADGSQFQAPPLQFFLFAGTGNVTFDHSTLPNGIDPRWFGMVVTDQGHIATSSQQSLNVSAINRAATSYPIGLINMQWTGKIDLNGTIYLQNNFQGMVGVSEQATQVTWTHNGAFMVVGSGVSTMQMDGIWYEKMTLRRDHAPGVLRTTAEAAGFLTNNTMLTTGTTPPTLSALVALPIGVIEFGCANLRRSHVRVNDCFIAEYSTYTTGTHGDEFCCAYDFAGVSGEVRYLTYLDDRGVGTYGTSMNGDWHPFHTWSNRGGYVGVHIGMAQDARTSTAAAAARACSRSCASWTR